MSEHSQLKQSRPVRRGVQSVEIGLRVLRALAAAEGPSTLTALSARSGLPPSQTHRYLQSLIASGMAVQDATARYDIGPGVIRLGVAALSRTNMLGAADAALARFVEATGWTTLLAVWGATAPVCVRWFPGRPPLMTSFGVGSVLPLGSAAASIFRAFLPAAELTAANVLPLPEDVARRIRGSATAYQDNVVSPGLRGMGAPIFDLQGRVAMVAVALAAHGDVPSHESGEPIAEHLRAACRTATLEAGGVWP